jgi:hypothetical protein
MESRWFDFIEQRINEAQGFSVPAPSFARTGAD